MFVCDTNLKLMFSTLKILVEAFIGKNNFFLLHKRRNCDLFGTAFCLG